MMQYEYDLTNQKPLMSQPLPCMAVRGCQTVHFFADSDDKCVRIITLACLLRRSLTGVRHNAPKNNLSESSFGKQVF